MLRGRHGANSLPLTVLCCGGVPEPLGVALLDQDLEEEVASRGRRVGASWRHGLPSAARACVGGSPARAQSSLVAWCEKRQGCAGSFFARPAAEREGEGAGGGREGGRKEGRERSGGGGGGG